MRITLTSVMVDDQSMALRFYTEVLGFVKHADLPMGDYRWLTVVSPEGSPGLELVLEPDAHPAAKTYRTAMYADGVPATSFEVKDLQAEHERLRGLGVVFRKPPTNMGPVILAMFDDTCGNWVQLHQPLVRP